MKAKLTVLTLALLTAAAGTGLAGNRVLTNKFERADSNRDNRLSLDEFLGTQGGNLRFTDARHSFKFADVDNNDFLSVTEFIASRAGKEGGKPTWGETFYLADLDEDGYLDATEFALTERDGRSYPQVWNKFNRMDKNEDVRISPAEWFRPGSLPI